VCPDCVSADAKEQGHNKNLCGIIWCYCGPLEGADAAFKPIREFRKPLLEVIAPMPYTAMQSLFDDLVPPGLQWYWKGHCKPAI
jgi:hypothetical protein